MAMDMVAVDEAAVAKSEPPSGSDPSSATAPMDRKVIKRGSLRWEVTELQAIKKQLVSVGISAGGYLGNQNQNQYGDRVEENFILYVPAAKFDSVLSAFGKVDGVLESKEISSEDVTTEFIDVEARIKTKKELELRLLELLRKGNKVSELLEIESKLAEVRGEIESMQGRMNYLKTRVSFSEINITVYKKVTSGIQFSQRIAQGFSTGWRALQLAFIGVASVWPFLLIGAVAFYFWRKRMKRTGR